MKLFFTIFLIVITFIISGCFDNTKITKITLEKQPMIKVCFNEPIRYYYGVFIITTKNKIVISNKNKPEVIIDTIWGKGNENKCDEFNPFNYLTNRWTTTKEYNFLEKNLKWSNIQSIKFILYKETITGNLEKVDEFTKKFK